MPKRILVSQCPECGWQIDLGQVGSHEAPRCAKCTALLPVAAAPPAGGAGSGPRRGSGRFDSTAIARNRQVRSVVLFVFLMVVVLLAIFVPLVLALAHHK